MRKEAMITEISGRKWKENASDVENRHGCRRDAGVGK
jgi:hypothetical protein